MQEVIGSGLGKLENKTRGAARNTWLRFLVLVINSFGRRKKKKKEENKEKNIASPIRNHPASLLDIFTKAE